MEPRALSDLRWEYRCWPGKGDLGALAETLGLHGETRREARRDIYILMPNHLSELVKLRDGLVLEWKHRQMNGSALQMWGYAYRQGFPLGAPPPEPLRDLPNGSAGAFLKAARARRDLRVIDTRKERRLFDADGVRAEITQAAWNGGKHASLALEAPTFGALSDLLAKAPNLSLPNIHYGEHLLNSIRETAP